MTQAQEKNTRTLIGRVVSDKRAKTVTVLVERRAKHELYGKIVARSPQHPPPDQKGEDKRGEGVGEGACGRDVLPRAATKREGGWVGPPSWWKGRVCSPPRPPPGGAPSRER